MKPIQLVLIVGMIALMFVMETLTEKFVDYSHREHIWLMMTFLIGSFLFLAWILIHSLISQYLQNETKEKKKRFIRLLINDFKTLGIILLISFGIMGFIILLIIAQNM